MLKNSNRMLALVLSVVLLVSLLPSVSAASLSDIKGHWAEDYIEYGVSTGYISGYTNGTFRPNNTVTRAEFSKMVNTALGINHSATIGFTDVSASDWFYQEVKKAVSAGYISGYSDNTFGANRNITRQEAAVMLARIVTEPETAGSSSFKDASSIASWALPSVSKMAAKTYMLGDQNNNFRPSAALTRAEAAKILYEVLKNEIIASTNQSFSVAGSSYYNTIYPNNVTITEGVVNGAISFNSCRILGTLTASGGVDSAVNLSNTGVNTLVAAAASGEAKVTLSGSSYVTKTTVNNGVTLSGNDFNTVFLSGSGLSSDTVRLNGDFETVNVDTDAVIKATGTIDQFTVYDRATLMIQSGSITRMDVEADAKNSMISLADGVTVGTAYIKTSASFTGLGSITTAYEGSGTVSYETRPLSVVGGSGNYDDEEDNYDDNYDDEDESSSLVPRFSPANRSYDVSTDPTIRLTFDDTIYRSSTKGSLTASYIEDYVVELREKSLSGYSVPFTASINSSNTTITIMPDEYLEEDTTYYIVVVADTIYNAAGDSNGRSYAYFTTEGDSSGNYDDEDDDYSGSSSLKPTFYPANGATSVSRWQNVRISFDDTVYRSTGSTLSASYIENNFELFKNSLEGVSLDFSASLNYDKSIITLTPTSNWEANTTYYILIPEDILSDSETGNNLNSRIVSRFSTGTTIDGGDIEFHPANGAIDVPLDGDLTITFEEPVYQYGGGTVTSAYLESSVLTLRRGSTYGSSVDFTASISSNKRTITVTPDEDFDSNTNYYLAIQGSSLQHSSSDRISATTIQFKTTDGTLRISDLTVTDVSTASATVYVTSNTTGNVTVTLTASTGSPITQTVAVSSGRKTSVPFTGLNANTTYTVTAVVKDAAGSTSQEKKQTFTTASLSFDLVASEITKDTATVDVSYNSIGTISMSYKKEGDTTSEPLPSFTPKKAGTKSIVLSGLENGSTYHVTASFEDAGGNTTKRTISFRTDAVSTEAELKSLTIHGKDENYNVELESGVYEYELTVFYTPTVTVTPVAVAGDRVKSIYASSTRTSGILVRSGQTSAELQVLSSSASSTVGYDSKITIKVTPESGQVKTYTITLHILPTA